MTTTSYGVFLGVLFAAVGAQAADIVQPPVEGDPVNGGRLYRLHCAACHGEGAEGNGPLAKQLPQAPPNLRDGGFLWSNTPDELLARMRGEHLAKGAPPHGRGLTDLELRDLVEWLQEPVPTLASFFPAAWDYVGHTQTLDEDGVERAEKELKRELEDHERTLMLFTLLKGVPGPDGRIPPPPPGAPRKVPEDTRSLYEAKPKRRMGFVGFVPLNLNGGTFQVALALDRLMRVVGVATVPTADPKSEKLRQRLDKALRTFEGSGGLVEKKPIRPQKRGVSVGKDVLREMHKAYVLVLEAGAMYQKEERDRFWADPEAFKFPSAAEMDEVKFDFKEKRKR